MDGILYHQGFYPTVVPGLFGLKVVQEFLHEQYVKGISILSLNTSPLEYSGESNEKEYGR